MTREAGFTFVAVMLMTLLVLSLGVYLCVLMANQSHLTSSVDSQLYSLVLAENGVEYARSVLPHLDLNRVLAGLDGKHSGASTLEWRNPLTFDLARQMEPDAWSPSCDDGWPAHEETLLLPQGYPSAGGGRFYIRFSNNPLEPAAEDKDGIVLVRSMGITGANRNGFFHSARNNVSLVEAALRQERVFDLQAALVLFGESATFEWPGEGFEFNGNLNPAVGIVGYGELAQNLLNSLAAGQGVCFQGAGGSPSMREMTNEYLASPVYRRVFDTGFWEHFQDQLPAFVDTRLPGLRFYPNGGDISGSFEGFLVARGDFTLTEVQVEGVILHLGGGRLTLAADTSVRGAIWMSNNAGDGSGNLVHGPLDLRIVGSVSVAYDAGAVRRSLTLLPPTQLGWRILFPEMKL